MALALVASLLSGVSSVRIERAARLEARQAFAVDRLAPLDGTIAFWREKAILDSAAFDALEAELKQDAFRLVGVWNKSFLSKIHESLGQAIKDGTSLGDWFPEAQKILDMFGGAPGTRLYSGERWSASYAQLVFRQASATAYQAGRLTEMFSPSGLRDAPYWQYAAIRDDRVRPEHLELDGRVFRKDDATSRRLIPPISWNCRCSSIELDAQDVEEGGHKVRHGSDIRFPLSDDFNVDRVEQLVPFVLWGSDLA